MNRFIKTDPGKDQSYDIWAAYANELECLKTDPGDI